MRRAILLPLLLLALPALADKRKPYVSDELGFSASFPYDVKAQGAPDGSGTAAAFDPAGIMYMVGVSKADEAAQKKTTKEQLDDGLAGAVAHVGGTIKSQKDVKLGANPGREAEIEIPGGHATFRAYIVGSSAYLIGVVHKDGTTPPMTPADFFASFKLSPVKAKKK